MKHAVTLHFIELLLGLLKGKTSIVDALQILSRDDIEKNIRACSLVLLLAMNKGKSLSESLRNINRNKLFFEPLYLTLITAAELAGNIETVLERIVIDLKRKQKAKETVINILIYPSIIVLLAIAGTVIIIAKGIPFFVSGGLLSKDVISDAIFGTCMGGAVLLLGGGALFICYFKIFYNDSPEFKIFYLLNFLLQSNVNLPEALSHCILGLKQTKYGKSLVIIKKDIAAGLPFSTAFAKVKYFSPYVLGWLSIASSRGNISEICGNIRDYYADKDNKMRKIAEKLIEPMTIVLIGFYLLIVMATVVLPILTFTGGFL